MKIALAQINPQVGAIAANADIIKQQILAAAGQGADLVLFPELAMTGYPPEDLLFREGFVEAAEQQVQALASVAPTLTVVLGYPRRSEGALFNSAAVLMGGRVAHIYDKQVLPNYGVFDEKRYFAAGSQPLVVEIAGVKAGISICEDIWQPEPAQQLQSAGADLILNINASPYHAGKVQERVQALQARCQETGLPVAYVNMVGGQDELVFDGHSFVLNGHGELILALQGFREELAVVELEQTPLAESSPVSPAEQHEDAEIYQALVLAVRDYVCKNGFSGAVIGLSGGVDSALVLAIAADALGAKQVEAVMMPSRYTSEMSLEDARACAENFAVRYDEISIEAPFQAMLTELRPVMESGGQPWEPDIAQQNIQARCRGMMLMAISNKLGKLVLATGNKSEMSVGYATLYGDMAGGFAPLKDISKQRVYSLCRYRNRHAEMIPERILQRPPSAELAPDQKDVDSLPEYDVLDAILERYLEQEQSIETIVAEGYPADVVSDVVRKVNLNEYKRRQAAPGVKITRRALGRERRYPITNRYD